MDDPLATTTVVDSLDEEMAGFAEADAMAMIGEEEELVGMADENMVNNTAFLENNYPLAISKNTPGADAGFGAPLSGDMIAAMMGGGGAPPGMPPTPGMPPMPGMPSFPGMPPAPGMPDPRKRGAMRGLGLR